MLTQFTHKADLRFNLQTLGLFFIRRFIYNLYMEKRRTKKHLFGFIGPTGAGKTELSKHLQKKHGFFYIPSITTRPPRPKDLHEYKHVEVDTFEAYIKDEKLLEYTIFADHYYGKLKNDVKKHLAKNHCVYTLTADQVKKLKEFYTHVKIICVLPDDPVLRVVEKRLKDRGHDKEDIKKRLKTVEKDLLLIEKLKNEKLIDHFVKTLETDYSHAILETDKIVKGIK